MEELGPVGWALTVVLPGSANGVETQKDNNSDISSIAQLEKKGAVRRCHNARGMQDLEHKMTTIADHF